MNLLDLPDCMLEQIFEHLSFDEISKKRLVCVEINRICQHLLNVGFTKMMKRHTFYLKKIKSQLPRRESERRNHALSKHADILTCIETRISMLSMTYTKYIDMSLCCFIPGKIIDEVLCILKLVDTTNRPLRAHEVLQELRDISSMAIDHFDEKIAPILKKSFCDLSTQKFGSNLYQFMQSPMDTMPDFNADIFQVRSNQPGDATVRCQDSQKNQMAIVRMERKYDSMLKKMNRIMQVQSKQMREVRNNAVQLSELKTQMLEFRRRYDDSANVNRIGNTLSSGFIDGNASTSSAVVASVQPPASLAHHKAHKDSVADDSIAVSPSQSSSTSSGSEVAIISQESQSSSDTSSPSPPAKKNIKPRAATIILKRRIAEPGASTAAKQSRRQL